MFVFCEKQLTCDCPVLEQLSYNKQYMSLHKIVQEQDDLAGLEDFQNAKFRYWAKISNCQYYIPFPDPEIYIEEDEHSAVIDPEVVADPYVEA